jgi:hypothetical protein
MPLQTFKPSKMTENSMKTETHHIKLPKRTGVCAVTEYPDRIVVAMRFSCIGCFGDLAEIKQWCMSIFKRYDSDPRPVVMRGARRPSLQLDHKKEL